MVGPDLIGDVVSADPGVLAGSSGMHRVVLAGCLVALAAAPVAADKLILTDGRTFTGTVALEGQTVLITVPYGTLRFPRSLVERIELKDTPEQEFGKRLAETALDDPNGLYSLARWAEKQTLSRQAGDLYELILKLDADHAETRRALGFVRTGSQWLAFDKALVQARGKLEAGSLAALLDDVLPALQAAANTSEQHLSVAELLALTQLRSRQFAVAAETFAELAERADAPASLRWTAIREILQANPDGMYVLRSASPPSAALLGGAMPSIQPGPASLAAPPVLAEALRDRAKKEIGAGKALMAEAQELIQTDPDAAWQKYGKAELAFDCADALVANISGSYRLEIIRRKIVSIRKDADSDAKKFDEAMSELGRRDLSAQAYRNLILRLIHHLDGTRDSLQRVLAVAKPFPRELVLEIKWAELDLTRIEEMRKKLVVELDDRS